MIHPTAIISAKAELHPSVEVGPYAIVEDDVVIGERSRLEAHAIVRNGSRIGTSVTVENGAVIGGLPQDLGFDPATRTYAEVGDGTTIRECVTINRATKPGCSTKVGRNCFLMATCHVGHDCQVGDKVVIGNACLLAGHVVVGDNVFFGGAAGVHQFSRVGSGAIVGGHAAVSMDVAPFTKCSDRNALFGLNTVGLRRRQVSADAIKALQRCYRGVFHGEGPFQERVEVLLQEFENGPEEVQAFLRFFQEGKRGYARPGRSR